MWWGRRSDSSSHLQAKADDVGNMRDDDGHLALYEFVKHLHCLTGLVLFKQGRRESFNQNNCSLTEFDEKLSDIYERWPHSLWWGASGQQSD